MKGEIRREEMTTKEVEEVEDEEGVKKTELQLCYVGHVRLTV
jgi:hypothetical protein